MGCHLLPVSRVLWENAHSVLTCVCCLGTQISLLHLFVIAAIPSCVDSGIRECLYHIRLQGPVPVWTQTRSLVGEDSSLGPVKGSQLAREIFWILRHNV